MQNLRSQLQHGCEQLQLDCSSVQLDQLLAYLQGMLRWNKAFNLTAVTDPSQAVTKHLLDSLAVVQHVPARTAIDVGSGAGLPGIPMAIMRPQQSVTLLDSNSKKTRFLVQIKGELHLGNVNVVHSRAEQYTPPQLVDMVISRAFAPLAKMVDVVEHLCTDTGTIVAMKGDVEQEQLQADSGWIIDRTERLRVPGMEQSQRHLLFLQRKSTR